MDNSKIKRWEFRISMIKTKFVIFSENRFTEADKAAIINAIKDLYEDYNIESYYIKEEIDL